MTSRPPRRSQQERRDQAIAQILDATITTILELGYSKTSVTEIARRAGFSPSGVFRHFASRQDLMVAAAYEVSRRLREASRERISALPPHEPGDPTREALLALLRIQREVARLPVYLVWGELVVAARTNPTLCHRLREVLEHAQIQDYMLVADLPLCAAFPPEILPLMLITGINTLNGENLARVILPQPELDEPLIQLLATCLDHPDLRAAGR